MSTAGSAPHRASASEQLAEYVCATPLAAIPAEVRRKALLCVLDTVGCLLGASTTTLGRLFVSYAAERSGPGPCRIIGFAETARPESAVLANSALSHVLELDDGHRPSDNHLGCAVVPAALTLAQGNRRSGADVLRAVIHGYDVMGRIGQAVCLPRATPFHHTATTGAFAGAAVAGLLLELPAAGVADALAIAGTGAAGLWEVSHGGVDCKSLQVGRSAAAGVGAAFLAELGVKGPPGVLDGKDGFVRTFTRQPRPELLVEGLGSRFAVMETAFKIHAACGNMFTAVDAALALRLAHADALDRIEHITVGIPADLRADPAFSVYRPATAGAARFSVPFAVAAALRHGEVGIRQISEAGIHDADIAQLEAKVEIVEDPEVERIVAETADDDFFFHPARVTLRIAGIDHHQLERSPRGYDPRRAMGKDELFRKFASNAAPALGAAGAARALEEIMRLEEIEDVGRLAIFATPGS